MTQNVEEKFRGDLFFRSAVKSYTDNPRFLRRDWLAAEVEKCLDESDCRFVLITAEPGAGKSTFIAQLADDNPGWAVYFIRRGQRTPLGDIDAKSFLLRTGYQLVAVHPDLFTQEQVKIQVEQRIETVTKKGEAVGAEVKRILASPFYEKVLHIQQQIERNQGRVVGLQVEELVAEPRLLDLSDLAYMALINPAKVLLQENPTKRIVILVDALDELRYHTGVGETILDWLTGAPRLPENLRFVLTSRHPDLPLRTFMKKQKPYLQELEIKTQDEHVQNDLRVYMAGLVKKKEVASILEKRMDGVEGFTKEAIKKADGNLGYLDALARGIDQSIEREDHESLKALLTLQELPEHIEGLYTFFLVQIMAAVSEESIEVEDPSSGEIHYLKAWPAVYRRALGVLAVAFEPLTLFQIKALGGIRVEDGYISGVIDRLVQFLDIVGDRYRLYHATLPEFLTAKSTQRRADTFDLHIDPNDWHQRIASHYRGMSPTWRDVDWSQVDDYGLEHTLDHLLNADTSLNELEKTISDLLTVEFINARGAHSGWHRPLVQDLYRLKDKLPILVFEPCIKILRGSHRNSLVNQEVLRLLIEVYRLIRYPPSPLAGARSGSKDWIIATMLEALTHHPERSMVVMETLLEDTADVQIKGVIVLAMGETGEPNAAIKLLDILFEPTKYVQKSRDSGHLRWCAADGLLALKEPDIVQPLLKKFKESGVSPWLRQQIIYVLGRMRADLPLEKKYRLVDAGLTLRQDCLPRALDAVYLLVPLGESARWDWSQRYQPPILAGLGISEQPQDAKVKVWTYPLTIKRALTALGRIGTEDGIAPLENFIAAMVSQEEAESLDEQEQRLLEAARRAQKDLIKIWS